MSPTKEALSDDELMGSALLMSMLAVAVAS